QAIVANETKLTAEDDTVRALGPGEILADLVDGYTADQALCIPVSIRDVAQPAGGGFLNARGLDALPGEPIMKVADQIGARDGGIRDPVAFAIGEKDGRGRVTGKLRNPVRITIVLQVSAPEYGMLSAAIDQVIELGDIGVPVQRRRGI